MTYPFLQLKWGKKPERSKVYFFILKSQVPAILLCLKRHEEMLQKLGKNKTDVGCLNKLEDINLQVLREMIESSLNRK